MSKIIVFIVFIIFIIILLNIEQFKIYLLNILVVLRGILGPNCKWYRISDLLLSNDGAGVNLYNNYKQKLDKVGLILKYGERT